MNNLSSQLQARLSEVKLLALDVDGVLTDGGLYYSESGEVSKKFGCFNEKVGVSMRYTYITDEDNVVTQIIKTDEIGEPRDIEDYKAVLSD